MSAPGIRGLLRYDAHDVVFTHHEVLGAFDLYRLAAVLAEQDAVASLDVERALLAVFEDLALADGDDFALVGFLRALSGMTMPPADLLSSSKRFNYDAVVQGTDIHHDRFLVGGPALRGAMER